MTNKTIKLHGVTLTGVRKLGTNLFVGNEAVGPSPPNVAVYGSAFAAVFRKVPMRASRLLNVLTRSSRRRGEPRPGLVFQGQRPDAELVVVERINTLGAQLLA